MRRETVEAWLAARAPARPLELAEHMSACVHRADRASLEAAPTLTEALAALGLDALRRVVARTSSGERHALELLAADAFVTYAFEAAAEEGGPVPPLVDRLLREAI